MSELMLCHCMSLSILSIHVDSFVCGRLEHTDVWLIHVTIICLLECYCILLFHDDSRTNCAMCFAEHAPLNPERNFVKHPDFSALYRIYRRPRVFPPLLSPLLAAFFSAANFLSCFRVKTRKGHFILEGLGIAQLHCSCFLKLSLDLPKVPRSHGMVSRPGPKQWPRGAGAHNTSTMAPILRNHLPGKWIPNASESTYLPAKLMSQSWQMLRETT